MLTFKSNIQAAIAICINQMTIFTFVQPTFYSPTREFFLVRIVGIVQRYIVFINRRSFASVRLFLFNIVQPISSREAFQLGTKSKNRNVHKILIIAFAHIAVLFQRRVVTHNNRSNFSRQTEVNYVSSRLVQIIIDLVFSMIRKPRFLFSQAFDALFMSAIFLE